MSDTGVRGAGHLARARAWKGVREGDLVVVSGVKGRRAWAFVAHVTNEATGEEWVEVRGGRAGEANTRSFRTDAIYPENARRGSRLVRPSLLDAPRLPLA